MFDSSHELYPVDTRCNPQIVATKNGRYSQMFLVETTMNPRIYNINSSDFYAFLRCHAFYSDFPEGILNMLKIVFCDYHIIMWYVKGREMYACVVYVYKCVWMCVTNIRN